MRKREFERITIFFNIVIFILILVSGNIYLYGQEWISMFSEGTIDSEIVLENKLKTKINLNYKNAEIKQVLRSLSQTYKLNIMISPEIKGQVNINLKQAPLEKALDVILGVNKLTYRVKEGVIYISGSKEAADLISETIFLKYVGQGDVSRHLEKVLSKKGSFKIDSSANSVTVTDYLVNVLEAKNAIEKIDILTKQIFIEAKVVDISSQDLENLGVKWNTEAELDRVILRDTSIITGAVEALVRIGKAKVLAAPSMTVLDREEARIVVGEKYPYTEQIQTSTGLEKATKFIDLGITLWILPSIEEGGYITMKIHPEISLLSEVTKHGPAVTKQETQTTIRVKDGEMIVLGGFIKQPEGERKKKFGFSSNQSKNEQREIAIFIVPKLSQPLERTTIAAGQSVNPDFYKELLTGTDNNEQIPLVYNLFDKARKLDEGIGIEGDDSQSLFRKTQALDIYEYIMTEFSDSEKIPEVKFNAAMIYYQYLKNYDKAKSLFSDLIFYYPDSPFAKKAKQIYEKLGLSSMELKPARPLDLEIFNDN